MRGNVRGDQRESAVPLGEEIAHDIFLGLKAEARASFSHNARSSADAEAGTWIRATA